MGDHEIIRFQLGDIIFEYDKAKNIINKQKHGISFKHAARVFFDYDRIELYDEENSIDEDRYNTIGDLSAGTINISAKDTIIGNVGTDSVLFVVYTERIPDTSSSKDSSIIRIISARYATNFERGLYYGKF